MGWEPLMSRTLLELCSPHPHCGHTSGHHPRTYDAASISLELLEREGPEMGLWDGGGKGQTCFPLRFAPWLPA